MEKKFYKYALIAVLGSAALSVLGSIILLIADSKGLVGTTAYEFLNWIKIAFDLVSLFVGLGTIIFGFARFGLRGGLKSMLIFCSGYLLAVVWFVIGLSISTGFSTMALMVNLYYSIGYNFITQVLPAIFVGLISYHTTKNESRDPEKFIGLQNPVNRAMVFSTLAVFAINIVSLYTFSVFPFLISEQFFITVSDFLGIIIYPTIESLIEYLAVQYVMYVLVYMAYKKFLSNVPQSRHQHSKKNR